MRVCKSEVYESEEKDGDGVNRQDDEEEGENDTKSLELG